MLALNIFGLLTLCATTAVAIPANNAPFISYACPSRSDDAYTNAALVRCRQAGCNFVVRSNKVSVLDGCDYDGVLCNQCDRLPAFTPHCVGFGYNQYPSYPPPFIRTY
ncbi:hypothetical protein TWF694_006843 [Orbilia ellipsospora]|uniref:Uncharacterized protein n=1 Tax=Orbilia ellipsospora TaxID=2528407 RepID=A0AAV9XLA0_9PEZI